MNKKAAVWHWIVLIGVLLALAVFLDGARTTIVTTELKGEWQMDFITNNYFESELAKLDTTLIAKEIGTTAAIELAKNGGYETNKKSDCDQHQGKNIWNKQGKSCFPDIHEAFKNEVRSQLAHQNILLKEISYQDTLLIGKGAAKTIETNAGDYTYQDQFIIDIHYTFDEYQPIVNSAKQLLTKCRDKSDLQACLTLPAGWHINDCTTPGQITSRIVPFCFQGVSKLSLEHHFALDFTPNQQVSNT